MCGIVGVIAKRKVGLYTSDVKMFSQMLYADQFRGVDGTGVFNITNKNVVLMDKEPSAAHYYIKKSEKFINSLAALDSIIAIGHNRAATKGKLSQENTHPFKEGHITLVHNGTLKWHKNLADVEVDSHAICHSFAEKGHEKTLQELDGAFALVWYNQKTKRLYMTRNSERPLNLIELKDAWLVSSEPGLAKWIAERNNENVVSAIELDTEHLYAFDLEDLTKYTKTKVKFKPKSKIIPWMGDSSTEFDYYGNTYYRGQGKDNLPKERIRVTNSMPALTTTYKGPWIDKEIVIEPVALEIRRGVYCLVGSTDVDDTVDIIMHGKPEHLEELKKHKYLRAIVNYRLISHGTEEWTVGYVQPCDRTYNGKAITENELKRLKECQCDWCQKPLDYLDSSKVQDIKVYKTPKGDVINNVYCEDCAKPHDAWETYGY